MKVRIMYGPKEGQILHAPFSENTQAQINSGLWEAVVEAPKPSETRWFLGKEELSEQHYLGFKCEFCRETSSYYPDVNLGAEKIVQVVRPHCTHRYSTSFELGNADRLHEPLIQTILFNSQINQRIIATEAKARINDFVREHLLGASVPDYKPMFLPTPYRPSGRSRVPTL